MSFKARKIRLKKCVKANGEYFEGCNIMLGFHLIVI